jgi:uncharacterized 2Fe-2S/4Fe-4S cluster protein (DUF4445 family)
MSTHIVVFQPDGACMEVEPGKTILEVATAAGVALDSACGGQGTCGKCKVLVTLGRPGGRPGDQLTRAEIDQGMVLACQATVDDDLVVEIPTESQRSDLRILTEQVGAGSSLLREADTPLAERVSVRLRRPELGEEDGDAERLLAEVRACRGQSYADFAIDLGALRALPKLLREQDWQVDALVGDFDGFGRVLGFAPNSAPADYGIAVDIGTTTVVVYLIDLSNGGFVDSCAHLNDQVSFGEDVISRIIYAQERETGRAELRDAVRHTINRCLERAAKEHSIERDRIIAAACVGNTVMTHLLLDIDPSGIRRDPYVPAVRSLPTLRGADVGLGVNPSAPVYLAPCVSSYVGGDVTAGVLATGMTESPKLTLFVDLGTNGEIVIGHRDWLMCCSCSAGPAFEGSGLEYGMYATIGAMERISYDVAADRVSYRTIGDAKPRGICGSGLVDALAELLRAGAIDRAGRVNLGFSSPRVRVRNEQPEFVLVWGEELGREDDISLGEDDIQNLVRSKSAVYAGVATLLEALGLHAGQVERVLLAGGFGNYIDAENAVTIGLLPDVPLDRIQSVGNTAIAGARLALLSREARKRTQELAARMTNFELSTVPSYMDRYVSGLFLPHTDLSLFPSVARQLEVQA